ncbi:uncharacterized protein VK521_013719 [Ammospiza maritima maritima]
MEPQELSPALLQPQVTVVAILGELLANMPSLDEMLLLGSAASLYWDLEDFTRDLWTTLYCIEGTWWHCNVTSNDGDPVTALSQALATYKSTPGTTWDCVTMAAIESYRSVSVLVDRWAQLARAAIKLHNTCREVVTVAADRAASATTWARELQDEAACYGTPQENMVEVGQALGGEEEAEVRREARVAASEATRATMVRQQLEAALGLLERLVAVCDEATVFPWELQHLLWDTKAALKGTNEASPDVPKDLVAKVAVAERLWESNHRLVKDHLRGTLQDVINFCFADGPVSLSACEVAERCQRALEDIPRLLRPPESPQSVPKVSAMSMEPQEVQHGGAVGDRDYTGGRGGLVEGGSRDKTLTRGWRGKGDPSGAQGPLQDAASATRSLSPVLSPPQLQVLVAVVATLGEVVATLTGPHRGKFLHKTAASAWRELVARVVDSWDWLAREATKLHEKVVMNQQLMVALDKEEVTLEMATHGAQVVAATNEAMGEAVPDTRRGHWAEVALGLLQRLVATCDRATLFYWNMEWQLRDIEAILKGTNEASPDVLQALMDKVVKFDLLWGASTRLAKDHLLRTLGDIHNLLLSPYGDHGGPGGPGSCAVAEQCQKAIEDIPRLLWGQ